MSYSRVIVALCFVCLASGIARAERLPPVQENNETKFLEQEPLPAPVSGRRMQMRSEVNAEPIAPSCPRLCLTDFEEIALTNNPTLVKAAAVVQAARGNWQQVGLYPNPNVAYLGTQIGDQSTAGQQGGYIEQEFVRGGKLRLNRSVAAREIQIAQQDFAAQKMRVLNDIRIRFFDALVAQQQKEITQDLVGVGEQALRSAEDLLRAQEVSRVDVLQAKVEVNEARLALVNAKNRSEAAWRQLVALAGVPAMAPAQLDGDLMQDIPEFTWEESVDRILTMSPELAASRTEIDKALWALRRARVEPIPNVTIQAGPQYDLGNNQTITNVNVVLPAPVFDKNQGNIRRAEADVRAARAEVARKELELTTKLATHFENYLNARNQVKQYQTQIMPSAHEAWRLTNTSYRQGEAGYLSLLTVQRTYFRTNLAYLESIRNLWESSIAIDGLLLTDSLQDSSGPPRFTRPPAMPLPRSPFDGE